MENATPHAATLDQRRAKHALTQVKAFPQDVTSVTDSMPAMVMGSGLGPALAFLKAKGKGEDKDKDKHMAVYSAIQDWLFQCQVIPWESQNKQDLIERLASENSFVYRAATREALAYLGWLKRLAKAKAPASPQGQE